MHWARPAANIARFERWDRTTKRQGITIGIAHHTDDLRACLRGATSAAHDRLDHAMRRVGGWSDRAGYAAFLAMQHAARAPVERWLAHRAAGELCPPPQTALIARDLAALGCAVPTAAKNFTPERCDPPALLGAAWVLAGSALGNRAILADLRRAGRGDWPHSFLADPAMLAFWKALRPAIERPASLAEVAGATAGAIAVFDHFLALADLAAPRPARAFES